MKKTTILLLLIVLGAFFVRLYRFNNPIADWHSWRQADTSAVSRNFVTSGYDLLHPHFDDLSNVPSGFDNPQGYRFVEFPIYNILQAGTYQLFGVFTLEEWGRLVTIVGSVFSVYLIYRIVKKYSGEKSGLLAGFFYAFLPFSIYYGRVILPDTLMVTFYLLTIFFFIQYCSGSKVRYLVLTVISGAIALLLKPYAAFFLLPLLVVAYEEYGKNIVKQWRLVLAGVITIVPLVLWRIWMTQYPQGIPVSNWLYNGNGIRFRPSFFRWLVYERLTKLLLGYIGLVPFLAGIVAMFQKKGRLFYFSMVLGAISYLVVFATGNVQHDYYQILIIPIVSIVLGLGAKFIFEFLKKHTMVNIAIGVVGIIVIGGLYGGWMQVKDYFNINNPSIIYAGNIVDRTVPKNAKVIALYNGDTSFLYQTKRKGWASLTSSIPEMVKKGADYVVIADPNTSDLGLMNDFKTIKVDKRILLLDIRKKP